MHYFKQHIYLIRLSLATAPSWSRPVILNRGAAEPLGAVKNSRGAANLWIWRLFNGKL